MKAGTLVRIAKRSESAYPNVRPGEWGSYIPGAWRQSESLPVDYKIVGYLLEEIHVGSPVRLLRIERNGERVLGIYASTPVIELRCGGYVTHNSVYSVETLGE